MQKQVATFVAENREKRFLLYSAQRYFTCTLNSRRKYLAPLRKQGISVFSAKTSRHHNLFPGIGKQKCTELYYNLLNSFCKQKQ
jgi:hypothetical protein